MQPSRFRDQITLDPKRLHKFVALDNLTSQMPLIEVLSKVVRIWVAYDLARVCGTYIEVRRSGEVVCVTQYEHDRTQKTMRPADEQREPRRLRKKSKQRAKDGRPKQAKGVYARAKHARPKKQRRNGSVAA